MEPHRMIAAARAVRRQTQAQLAARLNELSHEPWTRNNVAAIENGQRAFEVMWSGYTGDEWTFQRVKGGKVVTKPVHPALSAHADLVPRHGPYVFPGGMRSSRPHIHPGTVWQWCVDISSAAGVRITTHQLRHASITRVVDAHGLLVGQEWADHDDPKTTRIYSRVRKEQMREAMQSLSWGEAA